MFKKITLLIGFSLILGSCNGMVLENHVYMCNTSSDCPDSQYCSGWYNFSTTDYIAHSIENGYFGVCASESTVSGEICDNGKLEENETDMDCLNPSCRNSPYCMDKCDVDDPNTVECGGTDWYEYFSRCNSENDSTCGSVNGKCVTVETGLMLCFPKCVKNENDTESKVDNYCDNFDNTHYDSNNLQISEGANYKCMVFSGEINGVCVPRDVSCDTGISIPMDAATGDTNLEEPFNYCKTIDGTN